MSDTSFVDPYAAPERNGNSRLSDVRPRGYQIEVQPDGSSIIVDPNERPQPRQGAHYDNLANVMEESDLDNLTNDLLEAIEEDKEAREPRDRQYQEGLNRTGMGDNVTGGANFPGASRAVHPLLLESSLDFGGAMMNELLPPAGPCKTQEMGDENQQKAERAKRIARWMNYQLTVQMPGTYHEFEIGFTQAPLGGGFYTKFHVQNGDPALSFIPIDHVYRPYNDGDFYNQPRITHAQPTDRWEYTYNVRNKLWRDVVTYDIPGSMLPGETKAGQANDRIIGRSQPGRNIDAIREVYETSTLLQINDDERLSPYLVTIDVEARKVLSVYRNWRRGDEARRRLRFLIEWGFWPWRGGYPVGLTHMIGGLTGAATGSLRALLDAAMLSTSQTGMRLKGGANAGGQNMRPQIGEIAEVQGSLGQDDIRRTFMPIKFSDPSPVMLNLLGFLVDAGRGVVRSTYDDMDKFGAQTPVGTSQMFLEQGLRNFGSVHGRFHRSMRFMLEDLYQYNADTLTEAQVVDEQGELNVTRADFQGPMMVRPVSDPKLFSTLIRRALAQTIVARAQATQAAGMNLYNYREAETYFLRNMGMDNPDQVLIPNPQPKQINAVAENVMASSGQPVKAFPGQDHEAHIKLHLRYLKSELFGSNPSIAPKFIPVIVEHLGEHLALWYSDAILETATQAIRAQSGNDLLTLDSFSGQGTEVPLDRLMEVIDDMVIEQAEAKLGEVPEAIMEARDLLKSLAPPMPMDPSVVAQEDVRRQSAADKAKAKTALMSEETKRIAAGQKAAIDKQKLDDARAAGERKDALTAEQLRQKAESDERAVQAKLAADAAANETKRVDIDAHNERNDDDNATAIEITKLKNESVEKTVDLSAKATKEAAKEKAKVAAKKSRSGGRGGLKTGTGVGGGDE